MKKEFKYMVAGIIAISCILIYSGVATGPEIGHAIGDSIRSAIHN